MKLWTKGFETSREIERFTVGKDREMDALMAEFDVLGSLAHIRMLETIQLLTKEERFLLTRELLQILDEIREGNFVIEADVEDVHSQVELLLTRRVGEVGKKIHSGRSRNDQVLLDLKLFIRSRIEDTVDACDALFNTLISLSERYKHVMMPGYTHYQVAMPSSFGLWFGCWAESLVDDLVQLQAAFRIANKNPLGSAAGYGSSFPLNRRLTTRLLGFDTLNYNVVYAQLGRGKTERVVAQALASIAQTLGKMAQDICLFTNQNYNFMKLPDELTTGSSIMPHKKNPDVFELVRARANRLSALPNEISLITGNLSSGYHRDLQLIKESFMPAFGDLIDCLRISNYALAQISVNEHILEDDRYQFLFSVEEVNRLVLGGASFRDAYRMVGEQIQNGTYEAIPAQLEYTHEGSIGQLCNEEIRREMEEVQAGFGFEKVRHAISALCSREEFSAA
jgi:argininosuccinate lyase